MGVERDCPTWCELRQLDLQDLNPIAVERLCGACRKSLPEGHTITLNLLQSVSADFVVDRPLRAFHHIGREIGDARERRDDIVDELCHEGPGDDRLHILRHDDLGLDELSLPYDSNRLIGRGYRPVPMQGRLPLLDMMSPHERDPAVRRRHDDQPR